MQTAQLCILQATVFVKMAKCYKETTVTVSLHHHILFQYYQAVPFTA